MRRSYRCDTFSSAIVGFCPLPFPTAVALSSSSNIQTTSTKPYPNPNNRNGNEEKGQKAMQKSEKKLHPLNKKDENLLSLTKVSHNTNGRTASVCFLPYSTAVCLSPRFFIAGALAARRILLRSSSCHWSLDKIFGVNFLRHFYPL